MSTEQVEEHLRVMASYRVETDDPEVIAFVLPDPATASKNGLVLEFEGGKLVQITSAKYKMTQALADRYIAQMLQIAESWKSVGVETLHESESAGIYLYRDDRTYITIMRGKESGTHSVDITFTERKFHEKRYGELRE